MSSKLKREDLVHPELSYKIVGILFAVFNELGYGYQEKYYQRAIKNELTTLGINFKEQVSMPIEYRGSNIGRHIYDFLIENKVVIEIKKGDRFSQNDIKQTFAYLRSSGLLLGIIARFSSNGLRFKRIVNLADSYIRKNS